MARASAVDAIAGADRPTHVAFTAEAIVDAQSAGDEKLLAIAPPLAWTTVTSCKPLILQVGADRHHGTAAADGQRIARPKELSQDQRAGCAQPVDEGAIVAVGGNDEAVAQTEMALQQLGERQRGESPRLDRNVDDAAFARLIEVRDDGCARYAHRLGDIVLCHPFLVIEPARPDVGVVAEAQRRRSARLDRRQARPPAAAKLAFAVSHGDCPPVSALGRRDEDRRSMSRVSSKFVRSRTKSFSLRR